MEEQSQFYENCDENQKILRGLRSQAKDMYKGSFLSNPEIQSPLQIKKELYEKLEFQSCVSRIDTNANWLLSLCLTPDDKYAIAGGHTDILMIDLQARTVCHTFAKAHTSRINCMVVTKAGTLYTCSQDQTIKAWDLKERKLLYDFGKVHNSILYGLFLTYDEKYLVSGSADRSIKIWDLHANYKCVGTILNAHQGYVYSVSVTKDNKYLISGSQDRNISIWTFGTWSLVHTFKDVHFGNVLTIKLSQDEKFVYSTSTDGSLSVCDLEKRTHHKISTIGHSNVTWGLALTSDERFIFTFSSDSTIKVWDAEERIILHTFSGFDQDIFRGAITKDDRYAIVPGSKGSVFIIDLGEKLEKSFLKDAHKLAIESMTLSHDDKYLVTGGADGQVIVWELANKGKVCAFATQRGAFARSLAFSPCNSKIAAGYTNGCVELFSVSNKQLLKSWSRPHSHTNYVPAIMFSMDGKRIVSCSYDSSIMIRSTQPPYEVERINDAHKGWIMGLEITRDDKYIITSSPDKSIVFWNMETRTKAFALNEAHEAAIWNLKVTGDNKYLISLSIDTKINVWNIETKKKVHAFETSHRIFSRNLSLSKDDTLLVSTDNDGKLEMHNLKTKQKIYAEPGAKKIMSAITSDISQIVLSTSNSVNIMENPFHKLTVQFSESCSPYSLIRFMPLTSYLFNQNFEHRRRLVKSYPNLYVYPYTWNWFHIIAMFSPTKEAIMLCLENQIPCTMDCFGKTPLHYLLENDHTEVAGLNLALAKFNQSLEVTQRPLELMSSLSDIFNQIVELESLQVVSFLQNNCNKDPEPAFEDHVDIFGDLIEDKERGFYLSKSLLYSQETRKNLIARNSMQKISVKVLPFYWDYSLGSKDMEYLVDTLKKIDNQSVFETKVVSMLIEYLWNSSRNYYYLLCLIFSIQAILISIYTGIGDDNLGLEITIFVISIMLFLYEMFEAVSAGLIGYLTSVWNYLDFCGNLLVPAAILAKWSGVEGEDKDWIFSFVLSFIYIRWISYFRMFKQTRRFIRMIIEIFKGATSFTLVLVFIIFGLSLIFKQFDSETPYNIHLLNSYMLLFSNFDLEEISTGTMFYLLITIAVVCIVLLNMLIAIMGNTFGEVEERSTLVDSKEVLELITENIKMKKLVSLFKLNSRKVHVNGEENQKRYLFYAEKKIEEEDSDKAEISDYFNEFKKQIHIMNERIENLKERFDHEQNVRTTEMQEQTRLLRLLTQNLDKPMGTG